MRKRKNSGASPQQLKRKLTSALCMLLISSILMVSTSYAWLVLSVAPEVSGITTNIGANGALEIALLNTETRQDLSKIRTTIGESLANAEGQRENANTFWGNLIDLSVKNYGLGEMVLLPARLQYVKQADGENYTVNSGLLSVPTYGYDGRITKLTDDTVSALYDAQNKEFAFNVGQPDYGVRIIGTSDTLTVQQAALANAKANITAYTNSTSSTAAATLMANGPALFAMMVNYAGGITTTFGTAELGTIQQMISDLETSVGYIDQALRQGLVAVAASKLGDEALFTTVRDRIMDGSKTLSVIIKDLSELGADAVPETFETWITNLEIMRQNLETANSKCVALSNSGTSYTWDDLEAPLTHVMDVEKVYINQYKFSELNQTTAMGLIGQGIDLTLPSGSGVFADIADFAGDYDTEFTASVMGISLAVKTLTVTSVNPVYLKVLSAAVDGLEAAGGGAGVVQKAELTATYGYALDLAFRCNAPGTNKLLLQTAGVQRIYEDSNSAATMGGGSYMEFSTKDSAFNLEQMTRLMDAVRVGFIDDQGNLLKVAKLNTSNRTVLDGKVKASLYLYDFTFSEEDGAMIMGERQKAENAITSLEQNKAVAVTAVVWLDGDVVDNTMVSATASASLNGVLNLQFATDADLIPAGNTALQNITSDKTALSTAVEAVAEKYGAGQGTYTTVSWTAFDDAYNYARAIVDDPQATEAQIYFAAANLATANGQLIEVDKAALIAKIGEIRTMMGESEDMARIVVEDAKTGAYLALNPYTAEQLGTKKGEINQVDYNNNLHDEGNDVFTPIYTDESWLALASALYDAEATEMNPKATDPQIDAAITAMETAFENLQRKVFYVPYDYNGSLYYYAVTNEVNPIPDTTPEGKIDTYGKWYDADFKRVVEDVTILYLDNGAELIDIAEIIQNEYIPYTADTATPFIEILSDMYPSLSKEEIVAIQWKFNEPFIKAMTSPQKAKLTELKTEGTELGVAAALLTEVDEILAEDARPTEAEAADLITRLQKAVEEKRPEPEENDLITSDQVLLLSAAIDSAKSVNGFDSEETLADPEAQASMEALRAAVTAAQACVNDPATKKDVANAALTALNGKLTAYGLTEITANNTLPIYVPAGSERFDVLYAVESPSAIFYLDHSFPGAEISAVVLTKNGVICTAKKDITIYYPARAAEIVEDAITVEEEQTAAASVVLAQHIIAGETNAEGVYVDGNNIPVPGAYVEDGVVYLPNDEVVESYTWSSEDPKIMTATDSGSSCTVKGVKPGTTNLYVAVKTVQGNTYVTSVPVTVTAKPATP